MVREEILRAGSARSLVGVVSLPDAIPCKAVGAVLLNAGLVHRVGPSRLWVSLARRLAQAGHGAYRVDFSGIGDSPDAAASERFEVLAPREARSAMDALGDAAHIGRFALIGLCSGAEIAFKAALDDPRVAALVLINSPRFLEEPSAELVASLERRQSARYYWRVALRNPRSWWKALRGKADWRAIARAIARRARASGAPNRAPQESADAKAFRTLRERGVKIHLVLSEGDWGQDYLEAILGSDSMQNPARAGIESMIVGHADHMLTPLAAQRALLDKIAIWAEEWA